jgi:hypothetical protein
MFGMFGVALKAQVASQKTGVVKIHNSDMERY